MLRFLSVAAFLVVLLFSSKEDLSGKVGVVPTRIDGVELASVRGWLANTYPWIYFPHESPVHPVASLWTQNERQSPLQIREQDRQLAEYGSGADVLEFNPQSDHPDYNHWLRTYLCEGCSNRPFFILYEHMFGTAFEPKNGGPVDMDDPRNRQAFMTDLDFFFRNIIVPHQKRYVVVNGKAVIYMWASGAMIGDFTSLLEEARSRYPVFFIGSGEAPDVSRVMYLDGIMEYSLGPGDGNYLKNVQNYRRNSFNWRQFLRRLESETGKKVLYIPTFQAAYDDTKVIGRDNPPMYARSRQEVEYHAELIRSGFGLVYDNIGPFVVYSELPEGAAVIESQCLPETLDRLGRWVGCGTARLEILRKFFGDRQ